MRHMLRREWKMGKITLFHGTSDKIVVPRYGGGCERHDYGKGFYLTEILWRRNILIKIQRIL